MLAVAIPNNPFLENTLMSNTSRLEQAVANLKAHLLAKDSLDAEDSQADAALASAQASKQSSAQAVAACRELISADIAEIEAAAEELRS